MNSARESRYTLSYKYYVNTYIYFYTQSWNIKDISFIYILNGRAYIDACTRIKLRKIEIPKLKKYDKAPKIHFTEILLFENVTFRDIWGCTENSNAISENGKKGIDSGKITKGRHV